MLFRSSSRSRESGTGDWGTQLSGGALTFQVRNTPELTSPSHAMLHRWMSSGVHSVSRWHGFTPILAQNTGSLNPTWQPRPSRKGRYAVSRSLGRWPRRVVSSVTTSAEKPDVRARDSSERVISSVMGLRKVG